VKALSRPWYAKELGEPLSWVVGVLVTAVTLEGLQAFNLTTYVPIPSPVLVGVIVGMVLHELMHRNVARRYGLLSRYVVNALGVIVSLLTLPLPFKIIAPGYTSVYVFGPPDPRKRRGLLESVVAGPSINMLLSFLALVAGVIARVGGAYEAFLWLVQFAWVNAYLAFFNLLPLPPLDGSKVFRFSVVLWAVLFIVSIALLVIAWLL
jgi:Zn-dependent protease